MKLKAILFDTRSIQHYIFSGSKLRTNIGASYIVDRVFSDVLVDGVLRRKFGEQLDADSWKNDGDWRIKDSICQTAYIGGGNAMILVREDTTDEELKQIVTDFTMELLVRYPGLQTGAAIGELDLSTTEDYQKTRQALYQQLKDNQNTVFPQVNVPYTGLTLACDVSGEAANAVRRDMNNELRFYSQEIAAKMDAADSGNKALHADALFAEALDGHAFPTELNKLGQKEAENYFAIIHIDGNNMGRKFMKCDSLASYKALSCHVREKTKAAFARLLQSVADEYESYTYLELQTDKKGRSYLPLRPLILGGDDVTFVCNGRLALTYAERFIQSMIAPDEVFPAGIDCCGGIAILPTAYPFFRGYELAEQLCGRAKSESRGKEGSSWLDFALLHGEQAPTLEQIREQEYRGAFIEKLHFGPYEVGCPDSSQSIEKLFACICAMQADSMANNKVKELRGVLQRGQHDMEKYLEQMARQGQETLPQVPGWERYAIPYQEKRTPYIDAIEMMDYMPPKEER